MRNRIILSASTSIAYELTADSMGEAFPVRIRHPVRCRRLYGWPAHYGEVPRQDQTGQVPGRREQTGVHPLHERAGYQPDDGGRTISSERQIELFFKWVKQHLRIKKFWGNSENAVRIQIYSAVISYCIRAIVQKKMRVKRSVYEMLQIVSVSLTDTTPLRDLFGKPNYNIVNELDDYSEPTLFDF